MYSYLSEKVLVVAALYCFVLGCFRLALARRTVPVICRVAAVVNLVVPVLRGTSSTNGSVGCGCDTASGVIDWNLRDYHAGHIALPTRLSGRFASVPLGLCLRSSLLPTLLVGQDLLFVLLEADEVEMQILHAVFLKQVLSDEAVQINSSLRQRVVLIQGRFSLNSTEVASVIAHVQRLLLVAAEGVANCVRDDTS